MMRKQFPSYFSRVETPFLLLSLGVLLICLIYVYLLVMVVNYIGFASIASADGWYVNSVEPCVDIPEWCEYRNKLQAGDLILEIGDLDYDTYTNFSRTPFDGYKAGDLVPLLVRRDDAEFEIIWQLPEIRLIDRITRLLSTVIFIPFWFAGTIVLLFLRPRNEGWGLLVAFNYITALWLVFGFNSIWKIAYASILLHAISWLILPVYLHLHVAVPDSNIEKRSRRILYGLYIFALIMCVLEFGLVLPRQLFYLPFITAVGVSIGLLVFRSIRKGHKREKPATRLMLFGIGMGVGPALILAIGIVFTPIIPQNFTLHLSLISFPILPFAYLYAFYKRRLGRAEFRANRLLGIYTYSVLILMLFFLLFGVGLPAIGNISTNAAYVYVIFSVIIFVVITAGLRGYFLRWINQIAYGVKYDPEELISTFASQLSGVSKRDKLVDIISGEILPNLLIRQSMMFFQRAGKPDDLIYAIGVDDFPNEFSLIQFPNAKKYSGEYILEPVPDMEKLGWVRLVIPLEIRQHRMGVWLFGRRDPDDYYPQRDIHLLQSLSSLVAPVLENIQLFDVVQSKLDESAALLRASQAVNSSLDWPAVLSEVANVLVESLDVTRVTISEWNNQEEVRAILAVSIDPAVEMNAGLQTNLPLTRIHQPTWPESMPPAGAYNYEHIEDNDLPVQRKEVLVKRGMAQLLNFPIYAKEHLVGSVCLWEQRPEREFQPEEIALTQAIVQQVALAFENAQLFRAEEQRRQEAELLAKLSEYLTSTLELDEVLARVVESVRRYMHDIHNSSISILEPNGMFLRPHVSWSAEPGYDIVATQDPVPLSQARISRRVVETLQPVTIEDLLVEESGLVIRRHLLRNPRALLYVPLIVRGEAIGILHVNVFEHPYHFRPEQITFCVNVANQAATAIENARLFAAERRQLKLARTLQEMGVLLTTQLHLDEVFERIFELLARVVDYDSVSIQLFDKDGHHYLAAGRGFNNFTNIRQASAGLIPPSTRSAISEQGLVISDTTTDERWHTVPGAEYIRSWVGMPLQVKGAVIGMLNVDSASPHAYDETSVETIRAFANQAAVALENARLYRETEERVNELAVLHQVALATAAMLEADDLYHQTTDMIVGSLNYQSFGFLIRQDNRLAPHTSFHGLPDVAFGQAVNPRRKDKVLADNTPKILMAKADLAALRALWPELNNAVCVPVKVRQQVVSWLCAFSDEVDAFSENDLRFLTTLAGQVAGAIERAQLYDALQIRAADLAAEVNTRTAQLLTERDRMQAILHNAGEGIFFTSPTGILLYANPAATRLTGYRPEEVIGRHMLNWWGNYINAEIRQELLRTVNSGESWRGELTGVRKTGVTYAVRLTLAPIHDADGSVTGYVGVQSDITRLREVDRLRNEFIANVSHELRTPLTNIKTYLALLERGKPQSRQRHVNTIKMESERLTRLIEDLLDFSRRQPGQLQLELVELRDLVDQTVDAFAAKAQAKNIILRAELEPDVPVVMGDAHQLGQVLSNLVNNALSYTPAGGKVTISAALARQNGDREAFIRVSDNGLGIDKNDMPFIFERFYRGAASRQGNTPGTGLGLAISQDIVQRHGGHMHVESEKNCGSTFTVWLPLNGNGENPQ